MPKSIGKIILPTLDFLALNVAFFCWAWLRSELGFFAETNLGILLLLSTMVNAIWLLFFTFLGLYGPSYAKSRVDELISVFKIVSSGVIIIFLLTFESESDLASPPKMSRMFMVNYWMLLLFFVTLSHITYRTLQKAILSRGIGHRRTLIVGWGKRSWQLADQIHKFPALGYNIIGFISENKHANNKDKTYQGIPLLGTVDTIDSTIRESKVQEVILALKGNAREKVMEVMDLCNGYPVNFKIVPDLYDIVVGQTRTNQIYGFPLIAIQATVMTPWEQRIKRLLDLLLSSFIIIAFMPLWVLVGLAIKINSNGPVFYKQERVGKDGRDFIIYKFRSMVQYAESKNGPQWAQKSDPRITSIGKWLRKLRIDEVPQFINVLKGEMSFIGPRPERRFFVEKFQKEIPFYTRRLRVRPGITGWAQIKCGYDESFENVKTKLQYDLFYLENMSLRMDLKVFVNTIYVVLLGKGQ